MAAGAGAERLVWCDVCLKDEGVGVRMKKCSKCHGVHYCSVECQRIAWPVHKEICKPIGESRTLIKGENRAARDPLCGVCKKHSVAPGEKPDSSKAVAMGCGHTAHSKCLSDRGEFSCPTCGAYASIPSEAEKQVPEGYHWYNEKNPGLILSMALGYIYQAELVATTGKDGSAVDELRWISEQIRGAGKVTPEIYPVILRGAESAQTYIETAKRHIARNEPIPAGLDIECLSARRDLTMAIGEVFVANNNRDKFFPYIMPWLHASGL